MASNISVPSSLITLSTERYTASERDPSVSSWMSAIFVFTLQPHLVGRCGKARLVQLVVTERYLPGREGDMIRRTSPSSSCNNPLHKRNIRATAIQSHIWSLVRFPCSISQLCRLNPIYGLWVRFPCPTVLNPICGLWVWFPCPNCVESYGLWVQFPCPTVLNPIYGLWVRFPCPIVLNPIYGLCPYMVFGSGFPVPTVLNILWSLGPVSLSHCVESHIMVFGSGFLVPLC